MHFISPRHRGLLTVALSIACGCAAEAAAIPVFGTGTDSKNVAQKGGFIDPHYTLSYGNFFNIPAIVDSFHGDGVDPDGKAPGAWVPDQADAAWISVANSLDGLPANTPIYYTTTFDLTGLDPNTVSMTISWAADDSGTLGVFLNGVSIPASKVGLDGSSSTSEPWAHLTTFTIDSQHQAFTPGTNTLTFVQDPSDGYTDGIIAEISGTASPIGNAPPIIRVGGVTPIFSTSTTIEPGSWVSIYGSNLATGTANWKGDFPQTLGGTTVTINNKSAYLWYVSPGQLNLQAPDDTATGTVNVVVTTPNGTTTSTVDLGQFTPSFSLLDSQHVAGVIYRTDGSGAYGGGTYDIIGPTGSTLGFPTRAAKAGDVISLFGVGFGPTDPAVPAGSAFSGQAAVQPAPSPC